MSATTTSLNDTVSATTAKMSEPTTQTQDSASAFTTAVTNANDPEATINEEPGVILTEFPKFSGLPAELRIKIWSQALEDITPRVVEVYDYKEARVTPGFPGIFHASHESRREAFKLAKKQGKTMTLNAEDKQMQPIERTFYFNYKRDTLLTTWRFAPDFYGTLAPEWADDDFDFLFKLTENYRHRAIKDLFQAAEIAKVQKLGWHPINADQIISPDGFARFKELKEFVYLSGVKRYTPSKGQLRYMNGCVASLKLMFASLNAEEPWSNVIFDKIEPKIRAVFSVEDLVDEVEKGESLEKEDPVDEVEKGESLKKEDSMAEEIEGASGDSVLQYETST
ncbi:uncharacterized protein BDZ99DRAFT_283979 [Mytilinidion resinicola]|uniref:2EXR domain-containing protein n=1 Tax=Mytilinidion resinicola TaxID=574789 RepID=A0A6A6YVC9_9PEZI|nr:uncharacterized protein BDZ99DRAFT_283979 [Mytilinidion resinicola]KAF2811944.1 hypothetical protein BDZ99DRAFT_283979 [Mytilinidion resinicola]